MELSAESLAGIDGFRELSHDDRAAIARLGNLEHHGANELILSHKDTGTDVFIIVSGQVRATHYSRNGKEVTFRELGAGELFGEMSAIDGKPRSAHVVTLTESLIGRLSSETFWGVLTNHSSFAALMLKKLTAQVRVLSDRVVEFSTLGVKNRIHAELLRLAREQPLENNRGEISPLPTHADIASRVSTHREAVTRELNELMQSGLLEKHKRTLIITDMDQLTQMVTDLQS